MPAHKLLPDDNTLRRWVDEGLTHQQIADRVYAETGERVARSTISAQLSRIGAVKPGNRYEEEIPWRVRMQHVKAYPARMLRLLGRRRRGLPLNEDEEKRLDSWLDTLRREHAVVGYDPDSAQGFHYIEKRPQDGRNGVPIRKQRIFT